MIVECDRCSTKYRVREDRLPSSGGNIKCPGCAHVFFVAPPSDSEAAEPDAPTTTTPSQLVSTGVHQRVGGSDPFDAATRQLDASTLAAGAAALTGRSPTTSLGPPGGAPEPPRPAPPVPQEAPATPKLTSTSAAPPETASWKLKTSFGLVYDFPDSASLRSWLTARDDLTGYQLSSDGKTFKELSDFPDIMSGALAQKLRGEETGPRSTSFGLPTIGTTPDKVTAGGSPPPPRPSGPARLNLDPNVSASKSEAPARTPAKSTGTGRTKKRTPPPTRPPLAPAAAPPKNTWVVPSAILGLVVLLVMGLQIGGVVNFKKLLGVKKKAPAVVIEAPGTTRPPSPRVRPAVEDNRPPPPRRDRTADDSLAPNRDAQVNELLDQAKQEMSKRDYDRALLTLTSAKSVSPNDPEIFRLLDRVYTRQGNRTAARVARDRFKELKSGAASGGDEPN